MSSDRHRRPLFRAAAAGAVVLGLAAGSYGIAGAATGSGSSSTSSSSTAAQSSTAAAAPAASTPPAGTQAPNAQQPWGAQRSDETLLTGETAAKVKELALARVSGGSVVRVETDADGHAAYEAHMVDANGAPVTVYVDKQFNVVSVESR
jgi:hypothetical protein